MVRNQWGKNRKGDGDASRGGDIDVVLEEALVFTWEEIPTERAEEEDDDEAEEEGGEGAAPTLSLLSP